MTVLRAQLLSRVGLCGSMDFNPLGSAVHGIFQARILEQVAILLQEIFLTQGLNPHLPHFLRWQAGSLPLVPNEIQK